MTGTQSLISQNIEQPPDRPAVKVNALAQIVRTWKGLQGNVAIRILALGSLLAWLAADEIRNATAVLDYDLWWHLRTGSWILSQRQIPRTALFGRVVENQPWTAYSWGFESVLAALFKTMGLVALPAMLIVLEVAIAAAVVYLAFSLSRRFWAAIVMATCGMYAVYHNLGLRPALFTILFLTLELQIIFSARSSGRVERLKWLPLLFLAWSNLHIQFVYGLFVLALAAAEPLLVRAAAKLGKPEEANNPTIPFRAGGLAFAGSVLATFVNPYGPKLYAVAFELGRQTGAYQYIAELQALTFRHPAHFMQVGLIGAALFLLGRTHRWAVFPTTLLAVSAAVSLRSMRDAWFGAIIAVAVIASAAESGDEVEIGRSVRLGAAAMLTAAIFVSAMITGFQATRLQTQIAGFLPADAAAFIRTQNLRGPLYNTLDWGGFLLWNLPYMPVAIDGRTNLYGDPLNQRFFNVLRGGPEWRDDPSLHAARTLLIPLGAPLAELLHGDSRFRCVYQDNVALVFIRIAD